MEPLEGVPFESGDQTRLCNGSVSSVVGEVNPSHCREGSVLTRSWAFHVASADDSSLCHVHLDQPPDSAPQGPHGSALSPLSGHTLPGPHMTQIKDPLLEHNTS